MKKQNRLLAQAILKMLVSLEPLVKEGKRGGEVIGKISDAYDELLTQSFGILEAESKEQEADNV